MNDEDPFSFLEGKPTQSGNDTHLTHEPATYSADNNHENFD
jgi:hypothetical protein